ncbi:DUF2244 domain-containing protein [Marivibrio halodurans]|uniref:DUF2244 domain-containing protein n=1 Tax=Marivibrio halodurans TaxID=2039722 RepID=A0A8J7S5Y3_9PROT|nr:DUF2244 domain-containing protein [Marivibrio halodurans]MBP5859108.1 DUF2244 domain-containing protein [Marivibrio halodurans]
MTDKAHPKSAIASDSVLGPGAAASGWAGNGDECEVFLDATLSPHRSLSPEGFLALMVAIAGCGFLIGFAFFLAGAWPVAGFCGLEILLVYIAFKLNYRESRRREHLRLTRPGGLRIERVAPDGAIRSETIEPTWLRVEIADPPRPDSPLRLTSHGRTTVIGGFLGAAERVEFAHALRRALAAYRAAPPAADAGGDG